MFGFAARAFAKKRQNTPQQQEIAVRQAGRMLLSCVCFVADTKDPKKRDLVFVPGGAVQTATVLNNLSAAGIAQTGRKKMQIALTQNKSEKLEDKETSFALRAIFLAEDTKSNPADKLKKLAKLIEEARKENVWSDVVIAGEVVKQKAGFVPKQG